MKLAAKRLKKNSNLLVFPFNGSLLVLDEKIDVVKALHEAMLLVGVDFERLTTACRLVGYGLLRQVYFNFRLRISIDAGKEFLKE